MRTAVIILMVFLGIGCTRHPAKDDQLIKNLNAELLEAEKLVALTLSATAEIVKQNKDGRGIYDFKSSMSSNNDGVISNFKKTMKSNVYITRGTKVNKALERYVHVTDSLEPYWASVKDLNRATITWLYSYHISSNSMRIYPWVDMSAVVGPTIKWSLVSYFEDSEKVTKLRDKPFCTRPYDDLGGTGTNVSCCKLLNIDENLDGLILTCADISLKSALDRFRKARSDLGIFSSQNIIMDSDALPIIYKKQARFDLTSGLATYSDDFAVNIHKARQISDFKILNLKLFLEDK